MLAPFSTGYDVGVVVQETYSPHAKDGIRTRVKVDEDGVVTVYGPQMLGEPLILRPGEEIAIDSGPAYPISVAVPIQYSLYWLVKHKKAA